MLNEIILSNFKSFSDARSLELAPITLIFGPNSSGKSTIIQSLLALKQTLMTPLQQAGFVASGSCIDLNSYKSIVHSHDIEKDIFLSFSFHLTLSGNEYVDIFSEAPVFGSNDIREIQFTYSHTDTKPLNNTTSFLKAFNYKVYSKNNSDEKIFLNIEKGVHDYTEELKGSYYATEKSMRSLAAFMNKRIERISDFTGSDALKNLCGRAIRENTYKIKKDISLPMDLSSITAPMINDYLQRFSSEIMYQLKSIKYLGPLRTNPQRFYVSVKDDAGKMKGESNLGAELKEAGKSAINKINHWFKEFEIPYSISLHNLGTDYSGDIVSIVLTDNRTSTTVTPKDVGFGIGQVLPIITEAIISKNNVICVEQPEIHLHPRLQAHLADLFIDSVIGPNKEKNGYFANQWIIETHSEALMLRLQRRIREKKISKKLIKVYYVSADATGAQALELPLDDEGDFLVDWPDGFFEERLHELFGGSNADEFHFDQDFLASDDISGENAASLNNFLITFWQLQGCFFYSHKLRSDYEEWIRCLDAKFSKKWTTAFASFRHSDLNVNNEKVLEIKNTNAFCERFQGLDLVIVPNKTTYLGLDACKQVANINGIELVWSQEIFSCQCYALSLKYMEQGIEAGADIKIVWANNFKKLAKHTKRITIIDRYMLNSMHEDYSTQRNALKVFLNFLCEENKKYFITIYSDGHEKNSDLHEFIANYIRTNKSSPFLSKPLSGIRVCSCSDAIFAQYAHDRFICMDDTVLELGRGFDLFRPKPIFASTLSYKSRYGSRFENALTKLSSNILWKEEYVY